MRHIFTFCLLLCGRLLAAQTDFSIKFPDDVYTTNCGLTPTPPQLSDPNSGATIVFDESNPTIIVPDACYLIERTWYVTSANYDPNVPCINVPNPHPVALPSDPSNLPGPIVSPAGTPAPWEPSFVKIAPSDPAETDFSTFWSATANCYQYTQIIKVIDAADPVLVDCSNNALIFNDATPNNTQLWNAAHWFDPEFQSNNLTDWPVELSVTATDSCYGSNVNISYLLFLDLDKDGTMETVINSNNPPAAGQVNFDNALNPSFGGGTPREFDHRAIPPGLKFRFAIQTTVNGNERTASVGWNVEQLPGFWTLAELPSGTHKIKWIVEDACGNETICEHVFTINNLNPSNAQTLLGQVLADANQNCEPDPGEAILQHWKMRLEHLNSNGQTTASEYSFVDTTGHYFFLVDTGEYRLTSLPPNDYFVPCTDEYLVVGTVGDTSNIDFPVILAADCPFLETDIGTPILRRCFDNTYTVRYCNTGTADAPDAFVRVTLDAHMNLTSSSLPAISEGGQTWRFDVGDIPAGECGSFALVAYLDCDGTVFGQTHCVEVHIFPDSFCLVPPQWSGANVAVNGACQSDSVRFVLRNTGNVATSMLEYIVIEDNIITRQAIFQLPPNDSMAVVVPANGSTWRLQAEQEPGNPYNPMPSATVEACGQNAAGGVSVGFVSQFGEDDGDPFVSIDCQENRGSYDPNDKQGFPLGYGPEHVIEIGQPLEYLIRFQNTGNDTAFTVVVRDTLSAWLDPASVRPGASSHDYQFSLSDAGLLTFRFDNILLPDSNVNEPASHGFVKFRVQQRADLPLETIITNRAAIYFDFNDPVITNETRHQVGKEFVPLGLFDGPLPKSLAVRVSPNPASPGASLRFDNLMSQNGRFELRDAQGRMVLSRTFSGDRVQVGRPDLPNGLYFFKIFENGQLVGVGKVGL